MLVEIKDGSASIHKFDFIDEFSEGLAAARKNGLYGYIDTAGQWVIAPQFQEAEPFSEGTAAVCVRNNWGFVSNPLGGNGLISE